MHGMHGRMAIWLLGMGQQEDDGGIDGVEWHRIDELWRRMWRRKYVERDRLVEEARAGNEGEKEQNGQRKGGAGGLGDRTGKTTKICGDWERTIGGEEALRIAREIEEEKA